MIDQNYIYVSYFNVSPNGEAGICRSTDGGVNWLKYNDGLPQFTGYYQTAISHFPNGNRRIYLTSQSGVFYSDSLGLTWAECSGGLPSGLSFNAIDVSRVNPSLLYVADWSGLIYRSEDAGNNWQIITSLPGSYAVAEIVCDPLDENIVYVDNDFYGIYKSTNMGESWNNINGDLPPSSYDYYGLTGMAVNPLNPLNMYVNIVLQGCFVTYNGGINWSAFNTGLSTYYDFAVTAIAPSDTSRIYVGTYENSVWAYTRTGSGIDDNNPNPVTYTLYPNYPNPFNSSTTIRYAIPTAGAVTLDIYDILGRKVQTLLNVKQQPGEHRVTWSAADMPSGAYFARLKTGEQAKSMKLILLK
jgi:hypothetical protein